MSRREGEVVLTPAMARFVYGVIFEGREHIHQQGPQAAMLERFRKAGLGGPAVQLEGQQTLPIEHRPVVEYSSHEITPADERAAAEALATENATVAAQGHGRYVQVAGGVTGGTGGASQERYADPNTYADREEMSQVARDRAKQGHGVAAGTQ